MSNPTEHETLADFLRGQAATGDFGHDRERFARAADLLDLAATASADAPAAPAPESEVPA